MAAGSSAPTAHTPQALELDAAGSFLYAAGAATDGDSFGLTVFSVDSATGKLEQVHEVPVGNNPIRLLAVDL